MDNKHTHEACLQLSANPHQDKSSAKKRDPTKRAIRCEIVNIIMQRGSGGLGVGVGVVLPDFITP